MSRIRGEEVFKLIESKPRDPAVRYYTPSAIDLDTTDIKISDLSRGAQLTLWATRRWVQSRTDPNFTGPSTADIFNRAGAPSAAPILEEILALLSITATRRLRIQFTSHPFLTGDELLLLRVLRSLQKDQITSACLGVERIVRADLVNVFCRSARVFAETLSANALTLNKITSLVAVNSQASHE